MIFYVERETEGRVPADVEETGRRVAEAVLRAEGCPFEACVSLLLTDDAGIRALNRTYRKTDRETDVLSFPALTFPSPADFSGACADTPFAADPETGAVWIGDIAINAGRIYEQAAAYGHSAAREYAFLVAHSVLHLIGYDHGDEASAADMERRQERILLSLGFTRDKEGDAKTKNGEQG